MAKKVKFADLIAIPRKQRSTKVRQKTFTTHLLSSDENLAKIHNADTQVKKKTEIQRKRENALKIVLADEKKKKKCTIRKDTVRAQNLPSRPHRDVPKL